MEIQTALGSDIALVFDECTPFHADREYTARSTERTHRWLDRCLAWHGEKGPERQAVFGIVQGGVHEDLRRESAEYVSAAGVDGLAIGGTLGRDKEEMREVLGMTAPLLPVEAPKHLLGIGEVDDLLAGIALGLDVFDCAVPTRLARHGVALVPDPENRFRLDLRKSGHEGDRSPAPLPAQPHLPAGARKSQPNCHSGWRLQLVLRASSFRDSSLAYANLIGEKSHVWRILRAIGEMSIHTVGVCRRQACCQIHPIRPSWPSLRQLVRFCKAVGRGLTVMIARLELMLR
jgi:queuine tRNA-ribosyltransferase-like protein